MTVFALIIGIVALVFSVVVLVLSIKRFYALKQQIKALEKRADTLALDLKCIYNETK